MTGSMPLIRLDTVNPFLMEMRRRGLDASVALRSMELPGRTPASEDLFVAPLTVYELIERCGDLSKDPCFGYAVGAKTRPDAWSPLTAALSVSTTLGELLSRTVVNTHDYSSATHFFVNTGSARTTFGFDRAMEPAFTPSHCDAFYVGLMTRILQNALGDKWSAHEVLFHVCDPSAVPRTAERLRLAKADRLGVKMSFPSAWLFEQLSFSGVKSNETDAPVDAMPDSLVEAMRIALRPHVHKPDLSADVAAKLCGYNRRRLSKDLLGKGTSISRQIALLRADVAKGLLADSDERVADIAESVGYLDATVFSRAFKKWTGQSPKEYRQSHRLSA
ncbi:helix-turn-helix domain-containing protein [Congregibacter sp.]|uniref:AraC family transcriptional regulator n=1 Tax=Congregibacter sp. TaxID=2744308 RepID=UPI0038587705